MKKLLLTVVLAAVLLVGAIVPSFAGRASASSQTQSHAAAFDKTRFALHLGVAFFAVHHVYQKYQAGAFNKNAPHRVRSIFANGAVLLIGYHEAKVAYGIAQGSNSKTLQAVIAPLNALTNSLHTVGNKLNHGQFQAGDMAALNGQTNLVGSASSRAGYSVKDRPMTMPSGA